MSANHIDKVRAALASDALNGRLSFLADAGPGVFYACGACILESAAGAEPGGIQIACARPTGKVAASLAGETGLFPVELKGSPGVLHLSGKGERGVTLLPMQGPDILAFVKQAPFTVLGMAVDIGGAQPFEVIDPLRGLEDLASGALRSTTPSALAAVPASMLFAAGARNDFGLEADAATVSMMRAAAPAVRGMNPVKAWDSLARLFSGRRLSDTATFLKDVGLLGELLPEVARIYDVPQNYYHHLGVWGHTLETLDRLDEMMADVPAHFRAHAGRIERHLALPVEGGIDRRSFLALAALIHDVGKADTMTVLASGRIRFQGHQEAGGRLAGAIALRMGLGTRGRRLLSGIVRDHMLLGFMIREGESTSTRLRAATELGDRCIEAVMLSIADRLATKGEASTDKGLGLFRRVALRVLGDWCWLNDFPPLVDGREVMVHGGLAPGPLVGEALFKARVAQRESIVSSRDEALEFLAPDFKGRMDARGAEGRAL